VHAPLRRGVARIEKMLTIEVVGNGPAVKWHLKLSCVTSRWRRWLSDLLQALLARL
jgi:hypothetical protein